MNDAASGLLILLLAGVMNASFELIVITASLLGMLTGEWKNSGASPLRIE